MPESLRSTPPTGQQIHLRTPDGRVSAHVAQVGAALRGLQVDGVDHVPPYPLDAPAPVASGTVLVPWPNRVRDGAWTQRGQTRQLAITEPRFTNAAHGLLRFTAYVVETATDAAATLAADVYPQTGYPFHLRTRVTYALVEDGVQVAHRIENVGSDEAPVAVGAHPFVMIGGVPTSDLTLRSPGATRFVVDARMLPVAEKAVDAGTDLRAGVVLGTVDLDTAYGALARDADGRVRHMLSAEDGRTVTLWQGPGFDYAQVFTTDRYPGQELAVAIEPMTAPADALNSGTGLRWLAPGEGWDLEWGISSSRP
ncbi:aldose 1-epimerase family protein [Microbacterium sp. LRZ72]|uniref:aldose 1-epimerase family protein n=1 Tax=Microbacterium sp. LRZ72 TaxID=2942481 RepID=UPI0029A505DD|nr:aldose 1-epimerase family protein [Microbacterium sp. LRZ72]MDX2377489.1 aldose 1-epimerase family protein [Microbacterium sp. LRZ72]